MDSILINSSYPNPVAAVWSKIATVLLVDCATEETYRSVAPAAHHCKARRDFPFSVRPTAITRSFPMEVTADR